MVSIGAAYHIRTSSPEPQSVSRNCYNSGMSLVVAAHNGSELVIAWDSLSRSGKHGGWDVDDTIEKVQQINPQLAFMITGNYSSDKLQFIKDYIAATSDVRELKDAFKLLFDWSWSRTRTVIHPGEGFMMGLAGFINGQPSFRFLTRAYGEDIGYVESYPQNYYLSGEENAVALSEQRLKGKRIDRETSAVDITDALREIVGECIVRFPATLGEPVNTLTLSGR